MSEEFALPDFNSCCDAVEAGTGNPLEEFLYEFEPDDQTSEDFREFLTKAIAYVLSEQ